MDLELYEDGKFCTFGFSQSKQSDHWNFLQVLLSGTLEACEHAKVTCANWLPAVTQKMATTFHFKSFTAGIDLGSCRRCHADRQNGMKKSFL